MGYFMPSLESTYQSMAGLLAITVALSSLSILSRALNGIEHRALEIDRVDLADGGQVLFRQVENFVRRHPLRHGELVEGIGRQRGHTCFGEMRDDQIVQARVKRRKQKNLGAE